MASSYPGALDAFTNPTGGDDLDTVVGGRTHSQMHRDENDAIEAIQTELGTAPSGAAATVAARFAALDVDMALATDRIFHVEDPAYGAVGDGTTDDSTAINAAIAAAAAAGGGTVMFGAKTYLCNGPLITTEGGNAVLPIPLGRGPIRLLGVAPANNCAPLTDTGRYSIIKTTKTGLTRSGTDGVPSLIGGPTDSQWSETMVTVENLCVWLPANPTIAGVDLWHVRRCLIDGLSVQAINSGDTDYTNPTSVYAFALRTPDPLNYNAVLIRSGQAHGTYVGLAGSVESQTIQYWASKWCKIGWAPLTGGHGAAVQKMDLGWCAYSISGWSETAGVTSVQTSDLGITDAQIFVAYLAIEDYGGASKWYDPVATVNDSTNRIKGYAFYDSYSMTSGIGSALTLNGGANLELYSILNPSLGGGGGSLTVQDENGTVATGVTQIDFQGAVVAATAGTGEVIVTITGDGTGSGATAGELVMQDGVSSPPVPLENEAGTDWLYTD